MKDVRDNENNGLDRRTFMKRMGVWSAGMLVSASAFSAALASGDTAFESPGFMREPLPNACLQPRTQIERILAKVVETIVPGPDIDPEGEPGGLESCALNLLFDSHFPFLEQAQSLAALMELMANTVAEKPFLDCDHEESLAVLVAAEGSMPLLTLAYRAIRSAFYGGAYNGVGLDYLGYPGPSLGYAHLPQASFRRPVCREMTETGWMP